MNRGDVKSGNMYGRGGLKVLVNSITNANPERNEKTCEGNDAERKVTCFSSYLPQSRRECVNGEYLVGCALVRRGTEPNTIHTRVIRATPSAPACLMIPCAVQYGPVVTVPSWTHRILRIPPTASTMSYTKRESCDVAKFR